MIPDSLRGIYPNPVRHINGKPAAVFRDHRWTLPVIFLAGARGLIELPARVVMFDRHPDSLPPDETARTLLTAFREHGGTVEELAEIVANRLSARDDDWVLAGMEAGLVSDVVRFGSEPEAARDVTHCRDLSGTEHRIFTLGLPSKELAYKGALADPDHGMVRDGLWEVLGWRPELRAFRTGNGGLVLDVDLDFFTISWETYTFPFPEEVYAGEFLGPVQSPFYDDLCPADFFGGLLRQAGVVTVACEPDFCDGEAKTRRIFNDVDRFFFDGEMNGPDIRVEYPPVYPVA